MLRTTCFVLAVVFWAPILWGPTSSSIDAQELVAWETFRDDKLADNLACIQGNCSPGLREVDFKFLDGELRAEFRDFAMWRLDTFEGEWVEPSNMMSVRARLEASPGPIGLVGVGTDSFYWAGNGSPANGRIDLNAGQGGDPLGSVGDFEAGQEWIVQLDVFPDHLEAYSWPVNDPQYVIDVRWDRGTQVEPGVPVIWGNFAGEYSFKEAMVTYGHLGIGGDVNRDGMTDDLDIDMIMANVRSGGNDPRYNFTSDIVVDDDDIAAWVRNVAKTYFGDSNLDGEFNSADLIGPFQAGFYEQEMDAGWATGDWSGDGRFDTEDLIVAFQDGGYDLGQRASSRSVPEPEILTMLALSVASLLFRRTWTQSND